MTFRKHQEHFETLRDALSLGRDEALIRTFAFEMGYPVPGELVLNVDDTESGRYARTRILENAGFRVKEVATGQEALAVVVDRPALVLLDVNLPDMSGYEVCQRIKANRETAAIPVLQISATYQDNAARIAGLDAGAEAYLTEPVEPEVLIATVKALLRVRRMHEELEQEINLRRQAEENLRSRNRRLQLLSDVIGELLSHDLSTDDFVSHLYNRFSADLGLEVCFHYQTIDESGNRQKLQLRAWQGVPDELAKAIKWLDFGQAICGTVALHRERIVVEDLQQSENPLTELVRSIGITAYVCHPLLANERLLGTLSFGTSRRARFEADELDLLQTLSHQVALALEQHRLRTELLFQASLLGHVHNAVIATDVEGRIVSWNKGAQIMYQWTAEEVFGKDVSEVTVPPGGRKEAVKILTEAAEAGSWEGEFIVQRKDGTTFPAYVTDAPIRSSDGSLVGYVGVSIDLSEQKRSEEALREIQKFESLGFLAAGVAHNLNNLLVGIMGNVILVLETAAILPDERAWLETAVESSERAASLTSQLLAYAGKGRVTHSHVDLSTATCSLERLFRSSISEKIDVRYSLSTFLPPVTADESQIKQIITNLVINAAEAIGEREGVIEIRTRLERYGGPPQPQACGQLTSRTYVVLEVSDNGCGFDERIRSKIFDPFFSTKFTGRGLGLAAVAGIVRSHDGAINVCTTPVKGSTFQVFLPADSDIAASDATDC